MWGSFNDIQTFVSDLKFVIVKQNHESSITITILDCI